ncbi:MAG: hypothetical protein CM15mP120_18940 [Pseudomonadota bacterium]|nr:MAG: hypothetical protein CM15mP120_18940 [Pseudomonadota bacterium]
MTLDWKISDTMSLNFRANDRESEAPRNFGNGGHGILSEGPCINANVLKITSLDQCDRSTEYPETPTTTLVVCALLRPMTRPRSFLSGIR